MRALHWILIALIAGLSVVPIRAADPPQEYALKAAFVYNVMNFVSWPARGLPSDGPLRVLVVAKGALPSFVDALEGKRVSGRAVLVSTVVRADQLSAVPTVHVVFVAADAALHLPTVLQYFDRQPVLSIAEMDLDVAATAVISLGVSEAKLGFRVNLDLADRLGIQLAPNLLRLAKTVQSVRANAGR